MPPIGGDDSASARWLPARGSVPRDVALAIGVLRANLHRSLSTAELAGRAGVAERTLLEHFQAFIGVPPGDYGLRLRLAAVRRALQRRPGRAAITGVAARYGFSHLGRFAGQYRRAFGELPSATQRQAAVPPSGASKTAAAPAPRGDRPEILIMPFAAPAGLANFAELLGESIAATISGDALVALAPPRRSSDRWGEIGPRYVIRGRVAQAGEQLRVVAALADAVDGVGLWGHTWLGHAAGPLAIIDRAVAGLARAVSPSIREAETRRVARWPAADLEAYELCLRAYPLLAANTSAAAGEALDLLHRAIERDPDYALAAGLAAWGHAQLVMQIGSTSPADDLAQARLLSARAGMLDPDDAAVLTARCVVHTMAGEHDVAETLVERALMRNPRSPWALERRGWLKIESGDTQAAIACFGRSLRLDTSKAARATRLCGIAAGFFADGRHDLAARLMRRALGAEPGAAWINRTLAVSCAHIGERQMAARSLDALRRYRPDITVADVASAMRFPPAFVSRIANGLSDLGLPP